MDAAAHNPTASSAGLRARVKVLDPLTSIGPSMHAELLESSASDHKLWVPRWIIPGSTVQVLTPNGVVIGTVWFSAESGQGFEIEVSVDPAADQRS